MSEGDAQQRGGLAVASLAQHTVLNEPHMQQAGGQALYPLTAHSTAWPQWATGYGRRPFRCSRRCPCPRMSRARRWAWGTSARLRQHRPEAGGGNQLRWMSCSSWPDEEPSCCSQNFRSMHSLLATLALQTFASIVSDGCSGDSAPRYRSRRRRRGSQRWLQSTSCAANAEHT